MCSMITLVNQLYNYFYTLLKFPAIEYYYSSQYSLIDHFKSLDIVFHPSLPLSPLNGGLV